MNIEPVVVDTERVEVVFQASWFCCHQHNCVHVKLYNPVLYLTLTFLALEDKAGLHLVRMQLGLGILQENPSTSRLFLFGYLGLLFIN